MARIVTMNVLILAAGLGVLEAAFGSWLHPNPINQLNLLRDVRLSYDAGGLYQSADTGITYTRDRYGFRGGYPDAGAIDILTIGGSATDQRYITDLHTWQEVMRSAFARQGKRVAIVNAGVDGQSTVGHIRNFDWWFPNVPGLKAQFHLFYIGVNDFHTQRAFDELVEARGVMTRLRESSALYALAIKLRGMYQALVVAGVAHRAINFGGEEWTHQPRFDDHAPLAREPVERYRERLRVLLARSAGSGARPICVTQAARYYRIDNGRVSGTTRPIQFGAETVNGVDYFHLIGFFNRATLEICSEFNGIAVDAAEGVAWADADFYDFVHNTPPGARKLGEFLHERLAPYF